MDSDDLSNKPKHPWLLSNEDFVDLTDVHKHNEWALFILWDNGITSPEDSYNKIRDSRFQYSFPDCSFCGEMDKHYVLSTDQWKCKKCSSKFSITSGTYLDNIKLEYHTWLRFAFLVGEMKITNSCTIANDLGVTQKTAWEMLETLRKARKETSDKKFVNGQQVLVFNHIHDVLDILVKIKKNKNDIVIDKSDLLKEIYELIINQKTIRFKELIYREPITNSVYKRINLEFKCADTFIDIQKKIRIKQFKGYGVIGEETYSLSSPCNKKASDVQDMLDTINKILSNKDIPDEPIKKELAPLITEQTVPESEEITQVIVKPDVFDMLTQPVELLPEPESILIGSSSSNDIVPDTTTINPAIEKRCSRKECNKIKPLSEFSKGPNLDGKQSYCKECSKLLSSKYTVKLQEEAKLRKLSSPPPEPIKEKRCRKKECQKMKPLSEFYNGQGADGLQSWCKECVCARAKELQLKKTTIEKEKVISITEDKSVTVIEKTIPVVKEKPILIPDNKPKEKKAEKSINKPSGKKLSEEIAKEEARKIHQRNKLIDFLDLKNR